MTPEYELRRQVKVIAKMFANGKTPKLPDDLAEHERKTTEAFFEMTRAAKAGDKEAQKYYDKIARAEGNANWQEYDAELSMMLRMTAQELPAKFWDNMIESSPEWKILLADALNRKGIDIANDPVFRMIRARLKQTEIQNDPVLGTIQDAPIKELFDNTATRASMSIVIPAQSRKAAGRRPDELYEQAFTRISNGSDFDVVFSWYCDESKARGNDLSHDLQAARESFDAAMRRRRRN